MVKIKLFTLTAIMIIAVTVFAQWQFVGGVTGAGQFPSISVFSPNGVAVAGGPNGVGVVARSTNGGTTFTTLGNSGILLELYCVWARSADTIFVGDGGASGGAGGNARVYKTVNGGVNWTVALSTGGSVGFINGIVFSKIPGQTNFGVAQSDPPTSGGPYWVAVTTNAGESWTIQNPPSLGSATASAQNSIVVIDNTFYGFGLNAAPARVYTTSNGGTNWYVGTLVGAGGTFISGYTMSDDKMRGFATGNTLASTISKTTNGGSVWTSQSVGTGVTGYCNLKWVHGTNIVYLTGATGAAGVVKRSTDGGTTWTQMTTGGITGVTHFEYFKEANNVIHLYAVAGDGSVIRYRDSSLIVGINPNNNTVPTEYSLEQNYPNPFNPSTTINYSVPFNSNVSVKVYDLTGHEVATVADGWHMAGNYTETFTAGNIASGVYFYILNVDGSPVMTKKMMLVK